jgi:adenylylsulfate kinase-like enzyme/SAM-dependent methyltransferase
VIKRKPWGVVWLTGLPNSGKTSLADRLIDDPALRNASVIRLDGDLLRLVLQRTETESEGDRRLLGVSYARLALALARQGHIVIVSVVAMYSEVFRELENEPDRVCLTVLDAPDADLKARDWRGVYPCSVSERRAEITSELPRFVTTIQNSNDSDSSFALDQVVALMRERGILEAVEVTEMDSGAAARVIATSTESIVDHWDKYYEGQSQLPDPSSFALAIADSVGLTASDRVLDYGCGNGRDTFYFGATASALGIDVSTAALDTCNNFKNGRVNANRIQFTKVTDHNLIDIICDFKPTVFYCRFVLHAMTASREAQLFDAIGSALPSGCHVAFECRTIRDPMFLHGTKVSANERIFGHYRRFIVPEELIEDLSRRGFRVTSQSESRGIAAQGEDDPSLLRLLMKFQP